MAISKQLGKARTQSYFPFPCRKYGNCDQYIFSGCSCLFKVFIEPSVYETASDCIRESRYRSLSGFPVSLLPIFASMETNYLTHNDLIVSLGQRCTSVSVKLDELKVAPASQRETFMQR